MNFLALIVVVLLALLAPASAGAQQARPNVLVLMTDDQTAQSLRVMTHTRQLIAGRGAEFENSFVNYALCCPSRATYLTGQYAHNHGVLHNTRPSGGYRRLNSRNWLPGWLRASGYYTAHVGKFLNGYGLRQPAHVPPGWDEWYTTVDPTTYRFWNYTVNENGSLVTYGADGDPGYYSTDFFSSRAAELVTRLAPSNRPFFLSVGFLAPHGGAPRESDDPTELGTPAVAPRHRDAFAKEPFPYSPAFNEVNVSDKPQRISERGLLSPADMAAIQENYRQQLESLLAVDEGVWLILDTLFRTGELDNTLVIFTSDNGFFHGEHRIAAGKTLPYEPALRVPLLMRGPGIPAGVRLEQLVTNADLAPTILDAANSAPGRRQDGRSLLRLTADPGLHWGRELLIEGGDRTGLTITGLRNRRYSYVEYGTGERELYDLASDPNQLESLHLDPGHATLQAALARRLAALRNCAGRSCRVRARVGLRVRPTGCAGRRLRVRLIGGERDLVNEVGYFTAGLPVGTDDSRLLARRIRPRGTRPGRIFRLRAHVELEDGRELTIDRRLRACR